MALLKTHTLGCKVNQYETELVREGLQRAGFADARADQPADLCVVNTCTVTSEGDAKSRQVIRRLARQNPQAQIIVMGCYATRDPAALAALPQVVEVVADKRELPDVLTRFGVADFPDGISRFSDRHRAYVKVQDGCLLRCSYCIIPQVRPQMSSRPQAHIQAEVRRLVENGFREIVLTGVHLGHYGVEQNWRKPKSAWFRLSHLLRQLAELPGDFRLRLSSIEATEVTRELIEVMAGYGDRICPHLHLCLQSGSDHILQRMNRRWGRQRFIDRCHGLRSRLDHPSLTTDVIVGFPGETDEDFALTCQTVEECGFSKLHVFPFSPRRGTPAHGMRDQVDPATKAARGQHLSRIAERLRLDYCQSLVGRRLRVLAETYAPVQQAWAGTSCRYIPTFVPSARDLVGEMVEVRAVAASLAGMQARLETASPSRLA